MDDNGLFMFAMVLYLIRLLAGRDGRYSKAKYIVVKNKVLVCVLLDDMSIYTRAKRRKSDRNKMTYFGLGLYIAAAVVLLINIVCLIIPKVYTEPWIFETNKDVKRGKKEDKITGIYFFNTNRTEQEKRQYGKLLCKFVYQTKSADHYRYDHTYAD